MFYYFGYERKVRDWTVVRKLIFVKGGFLEEWRNNRFFKDGVELTRSRDRPTVIFKFRPKPKGGRKYANGFWPKPQLN